MSKSKRNKKNSIDRVVSKAVDAAETKAEAVSTPELPESTPASDPTVSVAAEATPELTPAESKPEETAPNNPTSETEHTPESSPEKHEDDEADPEVSESEPEKESKDAPLNIPAFANDPTDHIVDMDGTDSDPDEDDMFVGVPDDRLNEGGEKPKKHTLAMIGAIAGVAIVALLGIRSCSQPYVVTYDNGDGTSYVASYKMGEQINVDSIKKPVREGYIFDGWYSDKALTKPVHVLDQSSNITLYAKWIPRKYSIIYSNIPGGATVSDQDAYVSGEHKVLPTYSKDHYEFVGWRTPGGDSVITELSGNETGNLQLEAVFEPETYIITYVSDGITPDAPATYQYGDSFELPVSVLDGATFGGWYTDTSYQNQVTEITPKTYGDLTLYAEFDKATAQETAETVDYSGTVEGKAASVTRDFGVKTSVEAKDQATANALDIVYSSLGQYTSDARKKLGTVRISDHDGISGSDIYVNRSSSTISKDFNANMFRILCGNKSDSFEKGWNDYTSYISDKAATGSVLDDAAETWGYHMAGVYGDDQVSAKFGILYNLYGNYLN